MWILSLEDKLYWLLSGKTYTVGRASKTASSDLDLAVAGDASVSRKHVTLEVRAPSEDSVMHPSIRSEIIVSDLNSRFGTKVDGETLASGSSCTLPEVPNGMLSIKLGRGTKLRLKWQSFVVTYSTGQQGSAHDTLWRHALDLLRPLDVKLMPYIVKSTDVFVKTGKYTSSLYYALTKQIPVVNNHYFEALQNAAATAAAEGTLGNTLFPDPKPFLPDPLWAPNAQRSTCLANTVFFLPDSKYSDALRPVVESAGATYTHDEHYSGAIMIYASEAEAEKAPLRARYVLERAVFQAIAEIRPINQEDVRQAITPLSHIGDANSLMNSSGTPPRGAGHKRRRRLDLNVLDIMTSADIQPSVQPTASPDVEHKQTSSAEDLGIDTNSKTKPSGARSVVNADTQEVNGAILLQYSADAQMGEDKLAVDNAKQKTQASSKPRKRKAQSGITAAEPKRAAFVEDMLEAPETAGPGTETPGSDLEPIDYDAIGELAIVEASLDIPVQRSTNKVVRPDWQGRPNFKAFHRSGRTPYQRGSVRKILYDENAPTEKFDYDDFDMGTSTGANVPGGNMALPHLAQATSASKSPVDPGVNQAHDAEDEEKLFVDSQESDSSFGAESRTGRQQQKLMNDESRTSEIVDDFGFSFT